MAEQTAMKAITVKQPWAWAIEHGFKLIENRSANTHYRGPLAIHAGRSWSPRGEASPLVQNAWLEWAKALDLRIPNRWGETGTPGQLERFNLFFDEGAIVAVANLVDCHPDQHCCRPWGESEYTEASGRRRTAVHHLVLENVRPVGKSGGIPCRGALGLWAVPGDVAAMVAPRLSEAAR